MGRLATLAAVAALVFASSAQAANVDVKDSFFDPAATSINRGGSVLWTWTGTGSHSVTSDSGSSDPFDSGIGTGNPGNKTFGKTFNTPGTFAYHCVIHGGNNGIGMSGTVNVSGIEGRVLGDADASGTVTAPTPRARALR